MVRKRYLQQLYEFYLNTFLSFSLIRKGISSCKTKFSKLPLLTIQSKKNPKKEQGFGENCLICSCGSPFLWYGLQGWNYYMSHRSIQLWFNKRIVMVHCLEITLPKLVLCWNFNTLILDCKNLFTQNRTNCPSVKYLILTKCQCYTVLT